MRVAAVLIFVVAGYGVFEYSTTDNDSLYESSFINYQYNIIRGKEQSQQIDSLYNAENYNAVLTAFNTNAQKEQKDYFLAAQSYLHLNKPEEAISAFQQIEKMNASTDQKSFVDETDFYLALAYIKAGRIAEAEKRLNKITSDKQHLFYNNAENISRFKLKILELKN
jgi:tetratricopeptide (TPR) repeat protein